MNVSLVVERSAHLVSYYDGTENLQDSENFVESEKNLDDFEDFDGCKDFYE